MKLLSVLSALMLNLAIWGFIALVFTVGLAAADVGASTFYAVWVFFAAVMLGGTFLLIKWGREERRWLWRIAVSWSILFLLSVGTLLLVLIPLGLLALQPRFRSWLVSWLVPPRPVRRDAASMPNRPNAGRLRAARRPWSCPEGARSRSWSRRARNGIAVVGGLAGAYYATPLFLAIISLGEACPYSPLGTNLCAQSASSPTNSGQAPAPTSNTPVAAELSRKPGIRYAGTTAEGAEVCFTLTPDRSRWVEIGFTFVPASGCPTWATYTTGKTYYEGRDPLTGDGRITLPGFTATIRGARASGVLQDSKVCGTKTFKWSARLKKRS